MREKAVLAIMVIMAILIAGCATYTIWDVEGIESSIQDNPDVIVTSDIDFIKKIPVQMEPVIDLRPTPGLGISFERALEKRVKTGNFNIVSADLTVRTNLTIQTAIFEMSVEQDGKTYRLRHDWHTKDAGWGAQPYKLIPEYIDQCAQILADKIAKESSTN